MKIMIAEDDGVCRATLRAFLEKLGHEVVECTDGKQVLSRLFAGQFPQFLFLDWMMPEVDGLEVCRAIRSNKSAPYVHIVLTTAKSKPEEIIAGLRAGANDYIRKPVDPDELESRVNAGINLIHLHQTVVEQRQRLINASKLSFLGMMAGGMAHEINNPLAIIQAYATRIFDKFQKGGASLDPAAIGQSFDAISNAVARIAKIIASLRDFSAETDQEVKKAASVRELIDEVTVFLAAKFKDQGIEFKIDEVPREVTFFGQPHRVGHAILNLLDNAYLAVKERQNPWVRLEIFYDSKQVLVGVSDSGPGIPEELRARIMTPFFTTREVGQGSGLGLSVARGIIEAQKGSLELDTSALNTRFVVVLPRTET